MSLKISSGRLKGLTLLSPKSPTTRPTQSRVKEAIGNILAPHLGGARVLELFAGTGAVGLELLSRGAQSLTLVEQDRSALSCLKSNIKAAEGRLAQLELKLPIKIIPKTLRQGLADLVSGGPYDIILIDPPYKEVLAWGLELLPIYQDLLKNTGVILWECARTDGEELSSYFTEQAGFAIVRLRVYGTKSLCEVHYHRENVPNPS